MCLAQIQKVRAFNRLITQRIGALQDDYLNRGRSLGQARLIFEIGEGGAELRALRQRLGLDSGYVSRLLRALEAQGLVRLGQDSADRRLRRVHLTAKGKRERAAYDRLSDELAESMLQALDPAERRLLVMALGEAARLIRKAGTEFCVATPESAEALWCLGEYFGELGQRFEGGFDLARYGGAGMAEMTPPSGWFILVRRNGAVLGCGALIRRDGYGEIKRMWVAPAVRGQGVSRLLLAHLEDRARGLSLPLIRLDTNRVLLQARELYRKAGYSEIARFNDNPYAHHWFEKDLRSIPMGVPADAEARR